MPLPLPTSTAVERPDDISNVTTTNDTSRAVSQALSTATDVDASASNGSSAASKTKGEVERAAEKLYEERMEDEYAKREGGA